VQTFADQRFVRATAGTLSWQGVDADGEPADPGTVTIGVTSSDGSTVIAAATATSGATTNPRTKALTVAQTANLDRLTATWTVSGVAVATTNVDIVGGVYASVATIRATDTVLASVTVDPTATLTRARTAAEQLFESVTGVAWVPRFDVVRLNGTGTSRILLPWPQLRRVRWCRIYSDATTYTSLTAGELAAIPADPAGVAVRTDLGVWPAGAANIEIGYEHGYDRPPQDIVDALVKTVRRGARRFDNGLPDNATSLQLTDVGSVSLATPGIGSWHTGIPEVDEVLKRRSHRTPGVA